MPTSSSIVACPVCDGRQTAALLRLPCGSTDGSTLYPVVQLEACRRCGHSFNRLNPAEIEGLDRYYDREYAPANLSASGTAGDRPGSDSVFTGRRYDQLLQTLGPHLRRDFEILDVGCATGGFLDRLARDGFTRLAGVDPTPSYVARARELNTHRIERGDAVALPFPDDSFDVIVIEQVLEHLLRPFDAFIEAKRVLRPGGILCIGVPDAARYGAFRFFDFYWLLLREHIQHFDAPHLEYLAARADFDLIERRPTVHAVMSDSMTMPNLYALFRSNPDGVTVSAKRPDAPTEGLARYIEDELGRLSARRAMIGALRRTARPIYAWGIGREFLYLYEAADLKLCNLVELLDANPLKQRDVSIDGMRISSPETTLPDAPSDSFLLVTAVAHSAAIKKAAGALRFRGDVRELSDATA